MTALPQPKSKTTPVDSAKKPSAKKARIDENPTFAQGEKILWQSDFCHAFEIIVDGLPVDQNPNAQNTSRQSRNPIPCDGARLLILCNPHLTTGYHKRSTPCCLLCIFEPRYHSSMWNHSQKLPRNVEITFMIFRRKKTCKEYQGSREETPNRGSFLKPNCTF